jgi:hypothetical protein
MRLPKPGLPAVILLALAGCGAPPGPGGETGVVTADQIGVSPANPPEQNTAALQKAFDASREPLAVRFGGGEYRFLGAVGWPTDRTVTLDGGGVAVLTQVDPAAPLFRFRAGAENGWHRQSTTFRGFHRVSTAGGPALAVDPAGGRPVCFHQLHVADCFFQTPGYGIDLTTAYSIRPRIERCEFGPAAGLRWRPTGAEPHATSDLVIDQCRFHIAGDKRIGPAVWLDGHRAAVLRDCQVEGWWGYAAGADKAAGLDTVGVLLTNPGPNVCRLENVWFEHWGDRPAGQFEWRVHNPFARSAGAHKPGKVVFRGCGVTAGAVTANPDAVDVLTVELEHPQGDAGGVYTAGRVLVTSRGGYDLGAGSPTETGTEWSTAHQVGRHVAAPRVVYRYPGGTGADAAGYTKGRATAFPHRHPQFGACLAVRGYGHVLVPPPRRIDPADPTRLYTQALVAMPHHTRATGSPAAWLRLGVVGPTEYRTVKDGFAPTPVSWGLAGGSDQLIQVAEWKDREPGGKLGSPPAPWVLIYAATTAAVAPLPAELRTGPVDCYEWEAGKGPPPGTYGIGDIVRSGDGLRRSVCTRPGTSRPISVTGSTKAGSAELADVSDVTALLEGDWLRLPGNQSVRVEVIAADGRVTLSRPATATATRVAIVHAPPTWVMDGVK